ncbi:MAG: CidA/LrgA family protein [Puniceicoccales bacterium]|jgi:holin-like protein|nr:CidA/LrgA family protein [Puniceicoccales bacterium]
MNSWKKHPLRCLRVVFRRNRWAQVGALIALWWVCERVVSALHLPLPAGVVGLALLLLLLVSGRVSAKWFHRGASGILEHLVLFFVPAMLALVEHPELFGVLGLKLLAAVVLGTLFVMAGTALTVELSFRWRTARTNG